MEVRPSGKRASASSHLTAEVVRVDAAGGGGPGRAAGWCTSGRHCRAPLTPLTALATVPSPPPHCDAVPAAPADAALHLSLALSRTVRSASVGGKWGGKVGADGIMRLGRFCQHAQPPTPTLQDSGGGGLCERPAGPPHAGRRLGGGRGPRARRWRARLVTCRRHAGRVICGGRPGGITAGKGWDGGCRCGVNISCNFPNPEVSLSLRGISWASGGLISRPPSRRIRVAPALAALQTLQARTTGTIGLVVVQGGVDRADGAGPATPSAAAATLAALARVAAVELVGRLVDVAALSPLAAAPPHASPPERGPHGSAADAGAWRVDVLHAEYRGGTVTDWTPSAITTDATAIVTGGLGALGSLAAHWLLEAGAAGRVVGVGRGAREVGGLLAGTGPHDLPQPVVVVRADAAARADSAALACAPARRSARLLLHAGGVLADAALANVTPAQLRSAAAPKAEAYRALRAATAAAPVAADAAFSSAAGLLGSAGQAAYAAANAGLDACVAVSAGQARGLVFFEWFCFGFGGWGCLDAGRRGTVF